MVPWAVVAVSRHTLLAVVNLIFKIFRIPAFQAGQRCRMAGDGKLLSGRISCCCVNFSSFVVNCTGRVCLGPWLGMVTAMHTLFVSCLSQVAFKPCCDCGGDGDGVVGLGEKSC